MLLWLQRQFFNKPVIKVVFKKKRKKEKEVLKDRIILNLKNTARVMEYFHIFLVWVTVTEMKVKNKSWRIMPEGARMILWVYKE